MKHLAALAVAILTGCATTTDPVTGAKTIAPVDVTQTKLAVATHADLIAAAAYADKNGYPARAAVWRAHDAHLSAVETQINACANALAASLPKVTAGAPPTPFLAVEMSAEAVGNFTGASPAVKINCAAFPIITLPSLPTLP